ncbi:uncharacterized protein [Drosophila pseudoobscura]|uniref:Uncharacterized protein n=1 Tax=Drosophila pseudoobscura pseudoobscura TaxID=46245 RepID=A0A6I8UKC5_DROPS|nr:uncharacterized protein LOC4816793 [Drosophila pseudoobscura]
MNIIETSHYLPLTCLILPRSSVQLSSTEFPFNNCQILGPVMESASTKSPQHQDQVHDKNEDPLPVWSRLLNRNADGRKRSNNYRTDQYQVEISDRLWSLWGSAQVVEEVSDLPSTSGEQIVSGTQLRGKSAETQVVPGRTLACCVMACCASNFRSLDFWSSHTLDRIVANGHKYHNASAARINRPERAAELVLENLLTACSMDRHHFWVNTEKVITGILYNRHKSLGAALSIFFNHQQKTGILQLKNKALAFGFIPEAAAGGAFFMFHCQAQGKPIFKDSESAPYVLRMRQLQQLLHCILTTLNERSWNVPFKIHKVSCVARNRSTSSGTY